MRYVKWIFIVALLGMLTSFVGKDKPAEGLNVGNVAPDFYIPSIDSVTHQPASLSEMKGKYVLLSFWASYDAESRLSNVALYHVLRSVEQDNLAMISVSFDEFQSIFKETVRMDQLHASTCFVETSGESSKLFKEYRLNCGFGNYLLDNNGVIIAKNISASELPAYLKQL